MAIDKLVRVIVDLIPKGGQAMKEAVGRFTGGKADQKIGDSIRQQFAAQEEGIAKLKMKATPFNVKKQVGLDLQQAAAEKNLASKMAAATNTAKFGETLGPIVTKLGALGPVALAAGAAIGVVAAGTAAFIGATLRFGAAASPASYERLQRAMADTEAVIGRMFVPVLDLFGSSVRLVGDTLANVLPSTKEVRAALSFVGDDMAQIKVVIMEVAPAIRFSLVVGLKLLAESLKYFMFQVKLALIIMSKLPGMSALKDAASIAGYKHEPWKSSVGAAVTQARFSSVEDRARSAYVSAYSMGNATAADRTAKNTEDTVRLLEKMNQGADTRTAQQRIETLHGFSKRGYKGGGGDF